MAASSSSSISSGFYFSYFNEGNTLKTLLSQTPKYLVKSETTTDETGVVQTITTSSPNPDHIFVAELFNSHLTKFITFGDLICSKKDDLCLELEKDRVIYPEMMKEYSSKWNKTLLLVLDIFSTTIPSALIAAIGYAGVKEILFVISPPPKIKNGISKLQKPMYGIAIIISVVASFLIYAIFSNIRWSNFGFYKHPLRQLGPSTALTKVTELKTSALALNIKQDDVDGLNAFLQRLPQSSSLKPATIALIKYYAENVISALSILQTNESQTLLDGLLPVARFDEARARSENSHNPENFFNRDLIVNPTLSLSSSEDLQRAKATYRPAEPLSNENAPLFERREQNITIKYPLNLDPIICTHPPMYNYIYEGFPPKLEAANLPHQGL